MKEKRVLILGIGQTNYLAPLYRGINEYAEGLCFYLDKEKKLANNISWGEQSIFKQPLHKLKKTGWPQLIYSTFFVFSKAFFWHLVILQALENGMKKSYGSVVLFIRNFLKSQEISRQYDIFHVHFVTLSNVLIIPLLPRDKKIILSFWGSDLMRKHDLVNHYVVNKALGRASIITIQSIELKQILLFKYGKKFENKIMVVQFVLDKKMFHAIDKLYNKPETGKSEFIKENKINILIGHNANPENNHLKIVNELSKLSPDSKSNVHLIFVFGYGITKAELKDKYKRRLSNILEKKKISCTFIDQFLDSEQMARLRFSCDMFLHFPFSDALSAAVTESIYAGSIIFTGAWLPYGPFRRAGLHYYELADFADIKSSVARVANNINEEKSLTSDNKNKISKAFLNSEIGKRWSEIYED